MNYLDFFSLYKSCSSDCSCLLMSAHVCYPALTRPRQGQHYVENPGRGFLGNKSLQKETFKRWTAGHSRLESLLRTSLQSNWMAWRSRDNALKIKYRPPGAQPMPLDHFFGQETRFWIWNQKLSSNRDGWCGNIFHNYIIKQQMQSTSRTLNCKSRKQEVWKTFHYMVTSVRMRRECPHLVITTLASAPALSS